MASSFGELNIRRGNAQISTEGLGQTIRALSRAGADAEDLRDLMQVIGQLVVHASYREVPVISGALKESIRPSRTKNTAKVRAGNATTVPYAGPIHWGWPARNIAPQLFLVDAIQQEREEILQQLESGMKGIIRRNHLQP